MKRQGWIIAALAAAGLAYWYFFKRSSSTPARTVAGGSGGGSSGGAVGGQALRTATGTPIAGAPVPNAATQYAQAGLNALSSILGNVLGTSTKTSQPAGSLGSGSNIGATAPKSGAASPPGDKQAGVPFIIQTKTVDNPNSLVPLGNGAFIDANGNIVDQNGNLTDILPPSSPTVGSDTLAPADFSNADLGNSDQVFTDYQSSGGADSGGADLSPVDYSGGDFGGGDYSGG